MSTKANENDVDGIAIPHVAILMLIVGSRGDVQPFIALGQALQAVGHRVRLATHNTFRKFVRGNGLEFFPLAGDPDDLMSFVVKNAGIIPSVSSIAAGDLIKKRHVLTEILASTWRACTVEDDETGAPFTAEAIIANPPSFGHVHCAQKLRIPLHVMFTMPWSPTTAFPHPLCNVDYSKAAIERVNMLSYSAIEMLTWSSMRDLVNEFRKETLGLSALHTRQATFMMIEERVPYTYCWSPSLVPKPNDWASHINVSGFFFLDHDATASTKQSDDLLEFLGLDHDQNDQKLAPPIYIGFGSITGHDSARLLQVVLDALENTGYRALLSGLAQDTDQLPETVFKIGNVPHDWLFQHVSAVCHHGGAGTTAAGLRAGKPTIIVPFFGDQFFWGNVVAKHGAGPKPIPGKDLTVEDLVGAFKFAHEPKTRAAAELIRDAMSKEKGCDEAICAFHAHIPLSRMRSDLEPTFSACYRLKKFHLQVSRPVAQVLVVAGRVDQSQLHIHPTREWPSMYDTRVHVPLHGIVKHTQKALVCIFSDTTTGFKEAIHCDNWTESTSIVAVSVAKALGKGLGHLSIGCLSLYGELTDVLDWLSSLYDPYGESDVRSRPYIVDFKSGANAAKISALDGWKDGITGLVKIPRAGYQRHGIYGGVAGTVLALANGIMKPVVGTLSVVTWLCRGIYASVDKIALADKGDEGCAVNTLGLVPSSVPASDEQQHDDNISQAAIAASTVSGLRPEVCQQILMDFDQIKRQRADSEKHRNRFQWRWNRSTAAS